MRQTHDITYGRTGQVIAYRAPQGQPTAASFEVFLDSTGDDGDVEFSGAATVDTVDTTLSAAAGPGQADPGQLELTSVAGVAVGRKYLLEEDGRAEWVEVVELGASHVRLRRLLLNSFTTAATFKGTYVEVPIDDTWVADEANLSNQADPNPDYRVRMVITVAGDDHIAYDYFDLVRAPYVSSVTIDDIGRRWFGLGYSLPTEHLVDGGQDIIEDAERRVRIDLSGSGINDDALRENERVDEAVILAATGILAEAGHHPLAFTAMEFAELALRRYERYMERHFLAGAKVPTAQDSDSGAKPSVPEPIWVK